MGNRIYQKAIGAIFLTFRKIISKINLKINNIRFIRYVKSKTFPSVTYRKGEIDDLPRLDKIYGKNTEQISQDMNNGRCILVLAEHGGRIVGATLACKAKEEIDLGDKWWFGGLYVLPFYRGGKIGENLVRSFFSYLREHGIDNIFADISENNITVMNLSQKFVLSPHPEISDLERKVNQYFAKINPNSAKRLVICAKTLTKEG